MPGPARGGVYGCPYTCSAAVSDAARLRRGDQLLQRRLIGQEAVDDLHRNHPLAADLQRGQLAAGDVALDATLMDAEPFGSGLDVDGGALPDAVGGELLGALFDPREEV